MKKKLLILLAIILCVSLSLVACKPDDTSSLLTINKVLKETKANESVATKGVVFAKVSTGYYISDGNDSIFVADTKTNVAVGDEVKVSGKLSLAKTVIASITDVSAQVLSSGNKALTAKSSSLKVVNGTIRARANFYKYYSVYGTVTKVGDAYELVEGTDSVIIDAALTNVTLFDKWVGQKVDLNVIVSNYTTQWEVAYVGDASGIVSHVVNLESVKESIFAAVDSKLSKQAYLSLALPLSYELEPGVKFAWSVLEGGSAVVITDNNAVITANAADVNAVLKLTLSVDGAEATKNFNVLVKSVADKTLVEVVATSDVECCIQGQIITKAINSSGNAYSVVLTDADNNSVIASLSRSEYEKYNKGDTIKVAGKYNVSDGSAMSMSRFESLDSKLVTAAPAGYVADFSKLKSTTLSADAEYLAATADYHNMNGKLFKIVAPFMSYSGNTSFNFVRFGANRECLTSKGYVTTVDGVSVNRIFCFALSALDENGLSELARLLSVPTLNEGGEQYTNYTFYAYAMYAGEDTWQFVLPGAEAFVGEPNYNGLIARDEISATVPGGVLYADASGTMTLPTSTKSLSQIIWTSDNEAFNAKTGVYSAVSVETLVTLTATYIQNGVQGELSVKYTLKPNAKPAPMTITEAIAKPAVVEEINAYVAGFGVTSGSNVEQRDGLLLTDGINVIWLQNDVYELGGKALAVGDELNILVEKFTCTENSRMLVAKTNGIKLISSGNKIDYTNLQVSATVSDETTLAAYAANAKNKQGYVVKFTGEFYLIGTGSANCRYQLHYKGAGIIGSADARYDYPDADPKKAAKTLAFSSLGNSYAMGEWWTKADIPDGSSKKSHAVKGTIYAVGCGMGNTMHGFAMFNPLGTNIEPNAEVRAKAEIKAAFSAEYDAKAEGTIELPTSTKYASDIVWSVDNTTVFNIATKKYTAVTVDTPIVLTATYIINGVTIKTDVAIMLKAAAAV